jgi:transposase
MDENTGVAGVPGLGQRKQRGRQEAASVGTTQRGKPQAGGFGMRTSGEGDRRGLRAGGARSTGVGVPHDGGDRVRGPDCGIKAEKVPPLPSQARFRKRLEEAVGPAWESAPVRRIARQFGLAAGTVRAMDLRYLQRWAPGRRRPALRQRGVDEIYFGKKPKFLTVVSNLATGEPLWFGRERKKETRDEFFEKPLSAFPRSAMRAAGVDRGEPFRQSLEPWVPEGRIVYDKFHVLQHAGPALEEVRRAEFFRKGGAARERVRGKRWLLLTSGLNLDRSRRRQRNARFALNRRILQAYLLKESLSQLWNYT